MHPFEKARSRIHVLVDTLLDENQAGWDDAALESVSVAMTVYDGEGNEMEFTTDGARTLSDVPEFSDNPHSLMTLLVQEL